MRADPYELERFVLAQASVYDIALVELLGGRKLTHWMWFVFPQLRGLGRSPTAQRFGIASLDEARAYLAHAVLGPRLRECTRAVLDCGAPSLGEIFGTPDDAKFRSSMTLFSVVSKGTEQVFDEALNKFCDGRMDERSLELLAP